MITPKRSGSRRKGRGPQQAVPTSTINETYGRHFASPLQRKWIKMMFECGHARTASEWAGRADVSPYVSIKMLKALEVKGLVARDGMYHYHLTDRAAPYLSVDAAGPTKTARPSTLP